MDEKKRNEAYNRYVKAKIPKTKPWPSLFNSFWVGGLICCLGQGINDLILLWFPSMAEQTAWAYTLIVLIFLASFLTVSPMIKNPAYSLSTATKISVPA